MLAIRQEARSSCGTSSASSRRRRLTIVFIASSALAPLHVLVVIVWGCLHDGAHSFERELFVRLAGVVEVELLLPEGEPLRRVRHQAAAIRPSRFEFFDSPKEVRSPGFPFLTVPAWIHLPPSLNPLLAPRCLRSR